MDFDPLGLSCLYDLYTLDLKLPRLFIEAALQGAKTAT